MTTKPKFTNRQRFGACLVSVPFVAVIAFVLYVAGFSVLLGIVGLTAAVVGFIFVGVHFLNTPNKPESKEPFKFF